MSLKQKLANVKDCMDNSSIYKSYYSGEMDEKLIYCESRNGRDFTGNIFRIVEEISTGRYGDFKICVYAAGNVKSKIAGLQKHYDLKIDRIITNEKQAFETLQRAKYIFTDSGIRYKYVKSPKQVFTNTWHGTPIKRMGRDNPGEILTIGIIQHSLLSADYLLYPNDYMMERMMESYMIERIYPNTVLLEGYPRNSVFFTDSHLKKELGYADKEIFAYMPTFRGNVNDRDDEKQKSDIEMYLETIDSSLADNQMMLVNLHPYNLAQIDFSRFDSVEPFPEGYEVYDILNMADCLITDYSSVFFDFANTRRKIIIFNYDEEEYLKYRGFYFPLCDLPYPKVSTIEELVSELNLDKGYDDGEFVDTYCTYDNPDAARHLCGHIFNTDKVCNEKTGFNRENCILIYAGSLRDENLMDLKNVLSAFGEDEFDFYLTFAQNDRYIKENYEMILDSIPDNVEFLPMSSNLIPTFDEKRDYNRYFKSQSAEFPSSLHSLFKRSFDRQFPGLDFRAVIDLDIKSLDEALIFTNSDAGERIAVLSEIKELSERDKNVLNRFTAVAVSRDEDRRLLGKYINENKIILIDELGGLL